MKRYFLTSLTPKSNIQTLELAANVLTLAFHEHWPDSWADHESAMEEIREMIAPERICRAAIETETGNILGWIGGISQYDGHVWELHPLVVHPDHQRTGIGRALVADFEAQVRARGGLTITLGSDDENQMTSLAFADLYENTWDHIRNIQNFKGHPYEFYQKMGYVITGVIPDANGPGKPDILMSKRVSG